MPSTEGGEIGMPRKKAVRKITRDAGTGRFVPARRARTAPKRTVTETVRAPRRRKR
jgi:hypothetical protein